ncbi:hypothetical protein L7F22_046148 [Adiantum nelumboides]|nr:hypothetical protein [Adiantum nelumboides]
MNNVSKIKPTKSNLRILPCLAWWFHTRTYIGRRMHHSLICNFPYTIFWLLILVTKITFSYFLQILPMVETTNASSSFQMNSLHGLISFATQEVYGSMFMGTSYLKLFYGYANLVLHLLYFSWCQIWAFLLYRRGPKLALVPAAFPLLCKCTHIQFAAKRAKDK